MAKRTAVIDIGSNSARMAVYEKESRFAFSLIKEVKSRVRVGEGAYENGGKLQNFAIERALNALGEFVKIAKSLQCRKIICVATSAIRDAPNANILTNRVKKEFGFSVRVIDGDKEAYYGAVAVKNMLPKFDEATTIDIGGGSTELAKIQNGVIVKTISLNIGTVRLKELFFDKKSQIEKISDFIQKEIKAVDKSFNTQTIIGIGGTIRALGKLFITKTNYPLGALHGFEYSVKNNIDHIHKIAASSVLELKSLGVKKERYDTIREGSVIFEAIIAKLGAKKIITSGVGIREGVYLSDLLRTANCRFPENFNLSLESLNARFGADKSENRFLAKHTEELFRSLATIHKLSDALLYPLITAAKLQSIGRHLNFYQEHQHSAYFILNSLNYGFTHKDKLLVATIIRFYDKKIYQGDIDIYAELLPSAEEINWLIFIFSLVKILYLNGARESVKFAFKDGSLRIISSESLYLAKEAIKKINKPKPFAIVFE